MKKIFSNTLNLRKDKLLEEAKNILINEMRLSATKKRFKYKSYTYPYSINFIKSDKILGQFDPNFFSININIHALDFEKNVLLNILRHELAHYYCYIIFNNTVDDHGKEYRSICRNFNWDEEVYSSKSNFSIPELVTKESNQKKILNKVEKLLNLSNSTNEYESKAALAKANELILNHKLKSIDETFNLVTNNKAQVLTEVIATQSKNSTKLHCIYQILQTFYLSPIFVYGHKTVGLEVMGDEESIDLAKYVYNFLSKAFENLFQIAKKDYGLKGLADKNAFLIGVSDGYLSKISSIERTESQKLELIKLNQSLTKNKELCYGNTSSTKTGSSKGSSKAFKAGKAAGRNLEINKALGRSKSKTKLLSFLTKS